MDKKDYILLEQFQIKDLSSLPEIQSISDCISKVANIYFTNYSTDRNNLLKEESMAGIKIIDDSLLNMNNYTKLQVSFLFFVKSWLFDKLPEYSKAAEDSANKALKLNPFLSDSYNCIAHIIWKKGDLNQAINYFKQALTINDKDKSTLRYLSMIIRAKKTENNEERLLKAEESLKYAKIAVDLDLKDSESWYILGNASFHFAFLNTNQYEHLQKAVNSYNMAEKYQQDYKNPDLYYNRATVLLYLEKYSKAVLDLKIADSIDPTLKAGELAENVVNNIINSNKQIKSQCNIKSKKLNALLSSIPTNLNTQSGFDMIEAVPSSFEEKDKTKKYLITAKVIQIVTKCTDIPISLICSDHKGNFFILSIYNLSKDFKDQINPGVSNIVILEPKIQAFSFETNNKVYEYNYVSITDLSKLLLNGKYCAYYCSASESSSTFFI